MRPLWGLLLTGAGLFIAVFIMDLYFERHGK